MQRHYTQRSDEPSATVVAAPTTNEVAELRDELAALRDEVHRLRAERDGRAGAVDAEPGWPTAPVVEAVSRRRLFGLLGGATAGAGLAVAGSTLGADRAHAADGNNLIIGQGNTNTSNETHLTGSTGTGLHMLLVTQNPSTGNSQQAIRGRAIGTVANMTGVSGLSTSSASSGVGVLGQRLFAGGTRGIGVQGEAGTTDGKGVRALSSNGAALEIVSRTVTMPPTTGQWDTGSFVNGSGQLWYCYVSGAGAASQWARLSSTFVPAAAPVRVYDSRPGEEPSGVEKGPLNPGEERVVDVALNDAVPTTASAVLCNLSVVSTVNAGFLAMFKEDVPYPGHSSVNWSASGQITGNNATSAVAVDGAAVNVRVRCGGSGGTQFVVDVLGHYL